MDAIADPSTRGRRLRARLIGSRFSSLEWLPEVDSTNTRLLQQARSGAGDGTVLLADLQHGGRGRRGRRWEAPAGSALMMSVLLRPPSAKLPPDAVHLTTFALALAAADAAMACCGVDLSVKWPNDLVVDPPAGAPPGPGYRKVGGILTESIVEGATITSLVTGIGLNTGWDEPPDELRHSASSLNLLSGADVERLDLAAVLLEGFDDRYRRLLSGEREALVAEVSERSATVGRDVTVVSAGVELTGRAVGLDGLGRLVVDTSGGRRVLDVGEVTRARPV